MTVSILLFFFFCLSLLMQFWICALTWCLASVRDVKLRALTSSHDWWTHGTFPFEWEHASPGDDVLSRLLFRIRILPTGLDPVPSVRRIILYYSAPNRCVLPPCIDGSFVPLRGRFILVVDEGKLDSFEKQFESPLNGKCFTREKISVINCHRQLQILILKGSFVLLKGKNKQKRTKATEENAVSCHFRICSPREH